jgi:hypothetical protein
MEKTKQQQDIEDFMTFVENTREGKFSDKDVSFREILQCTISREDVIFLENDITQDVGTVLYGIH